MHAFVLVHQPKTTAQTTVSSRPVRCHAVSDSSSDSNLILQHLVERRPLSRYFTVSMTFLRIVDICYLSVTPNNSMLLHHTRVDASLKHSMVACWIRRLVISRLAINNVYELSQLGHVMRRDCAYQRKREYARDRR